jgi:hypothetical protein
MPKKPAKKGGKKPAKGNDSDSDRELESKMKKVNVRDEDDAGEEDFGDDDYDADKAAVDGEKEETEDATEDGDAAGGEPGQPALSRKEMKKKKKLVRRLVLS